MSFDRREAEVTRQIDLNCDGGESFGIYRLGNDEAMMTQITSISIGCGFHGGDPHVMRKTVAMAKKYNVAVGAHPGFPDPIGFGRRKMEITPEEAKDYILYQVGALKAFCEAYGVALQHVKPHGQFYNMAWTDEDLARAILEAIQTMKPEPIFLALYNTVPYELANSMGIRVAGEFYADLDYAPDGTTFIKKIHEDVDVAATVDKVVRMIVEGKTTASNGKDIEVRGSSVCFHGDNPQGPEIVKAVGARLQEHGVDVVALGRQNQLM